MNKKYLIDLIMCEKEDPTRKVEHPSDVYAFLSSYANKKVEHFLVVTLDGEHKIIKKHLITKGLANRTMAHPREVFLPAIKDRAVSIIIAHNHPSGNLTASHEDKELTERMEEAGKIIGINVIDSVIISKNGFVSKIGGW